MLGVMGFGRSERSTKRALVVDQLESSGEGEGNAPRTTKVVSFVGGQGRDGGGGGDGDTDAEAGDDGTRDDASDDGQVFEGGGCGGGGAGGSSEGVGEGSP